MKRKSFLAYPYVVWSAIFVIIPLILVVFLLVFYIMKYKTAGIFLDDDFVSIVSGKFSKSINIIKYKNTKTKY